MLTLPLPENEPVLIYDHTGLETRAEWDARDLLSSQHDIYQASVKRTGPDEWDPIEVTLQQGADDHQADLVLILHPYDRDAETNEIICDMAIGSVNGTDGMGSDEMLDAIREAIAYCKVALLPYKFY